MKIDYIIQEQNNAGPYRDDDSDIFRNLSWPNNERNTKEIIKIFKCFGLSLVVTTNVTSGNYLDFNFDLTTDIYKPYKKLNDGPVYINKYSDHSSNIVRQIPLSASSIISNIS